MTKLALYHFGLFVQELMSAENVFDAGKAALKFKQDAIEVERDLIKSMDRLVELEKRVGGKNTI